MATLAWPCRIRLAHAHASVSMAPAPWLSSMLPTGCQLCQHWGSINGQ